MYIQNAFTLFTVISRINWFFPPLCDITNIFIHGKYHVIYLVRWLVMQPIVSINLTQNRRLLSTIFILAFKLRKNETS